MRNMKTMLALCLLTSSACAAAHGYLAKPESRAYLCNKGGNSHCGPVQYEPQSVEGYSGFPQQGPADGQIASAGLAHGTRPDFGILDEQTSTRWTKRAMQAGPNSFTWTFTAPHRTRNWRYYLTREGWNPNQKLSRASFEPAPFCVIDGKMALPPAQVTHACDLPRRSGYQVILAVWEVGDTPMSFYHVIDAMVGEGGSIPDATWMQKGTIQPSVDLKTGDSVETRVFDLNGERAEFKTRIVIANDSDGQRNTWPFLLAMRINAEQSLLRAGQAGANGSFNPAPGTNPVHARSGSGLVSVEVQVNKAEAPVAADLSISGLRPAYVFQDGQLAIDLNVTAIGDQEVSLHVFDRDSVTRGTTALNLNNATQTVRISLSRLMPGPHQLVLKGTVRGSGQVLQKTYQVDLQLATAAPSAGYDHIFPAGLGSYRAGTRVLQPKTGRTYACRPFPYSGYCNQWSTSATQYEPGTGTHWQQAWTLP